MGIYAICDSIGIHDGEGSEDANCEDVLNEYALTHPLNGLLQAAYYAIDYESARCTTWGAGFTQNTVLEDLYDFLVELGYEMSDDEQALMDGTHELYLSGKPEKDLDDVIGEED
jgi:hypothetical protein